MKEVKYSQSGKPKCPECGKYKSNMNVIKIDGYNRVIFNCLWCSNSGCLYYAEIDDCDEDTVDKILSRLRRDFYQCQDQDEKEKIKNHIEYMFNQK